MRYASESASVHRGPAADGRRRPATPPARAPRPPVEWLEPRTLLSAGSLDPSFGTGGQMAIQFPSGQTVTVVRDSLVQPDGKIVITGQALESAGSNATDFVIARLNPDGSPDTTFNGTGIFLFPSPGDGDVGTGVARQSDGKLVVSAAFIEDRPDMANYSLYAVGRFNPDGSLDLAFGDEGAEVIDFTTNGTSQQDGVARDVLVGPDDKITLIGNAAPDPSAPVSDIALARLNPDGTMDDTFGTGGKLLFGTPDDAESAFSGAFDAAGNIITAGLIVPPGATVGQFLTARFLPSGAIDSTFGDNGIVRSDFSNPADAAAVAVADAVAVQPDGKIVVGGLSAHADAAATLTGANAALARFNPDGTPDATFGAGGQVESRLGPITSINKLLVDSAGRIVASGLLAANQDAVNNLQFDAFVAQYAPAGALDPTFGTGGLVTIAAANPGAAPGAVVRPSAVRPATPQAAVATAMAAAGLVPTADTTGDQAQQAAAAIQRQSAIAVAVGDKFLVVTSTSDQLKAARLIGNGGDLAAGVVTGIKVTSVLGGAKGALAFTVTDTGNAAVIATASVRVVLSTDTTFDAGDTTASTSTVKLKLQPGKGKGLKAKFAYPTSLADGQYFVLAVIDAGTADVNAANNAGSTPAAVTVAKPFVDLSGTFATPPPLTVGKKAKLVLNLRNDGNVPAKGTVQVTLYASADNALDAAADRTIAGPLNLKVGFKANGAKASKLSPTILADLAPGPYFLIAVINDPAFPESDVADNTLVTAGPATVS